MSPEYHHHRRFSTLLGSLPLRLGSRALSETRKNSESVKPSPSSEASESSSDNVSPAATLNPGGTKNISWTSSAINCVNLRTRGVADEPCSRMNSCNFACAFITIARKEKARVHSRSARMSAARKGGGKIEQRRSPDAVQCVQVTLDVGGKFFPST